MSEDDYTRPERSAELMKARRARKRYDAYKAKHGLCSVCKHRNRSETFWGRSVCRVGHQRTELVCAKDGKGVTFEVDVECLEQFRDKAA